MSDVRDLLDGIEKRAESATPGPWVADVNAVRPSSPAWECLALAYPTPHHRDNAQFIAHARTDVPRLVAALRAVLDLHGEVEAPWCDCLEPHCKCGHIWPCIDLAELTAAITEALGGGA